MIDLHCHVLFNIDDGCKTIEDSLRLCRIAAENKITHVAATPHFLTFFNSEEFFEKRNSHVRMLNEALKREQIPVKMMIGAEVACSGGMFHFKQMKRLAINSTRYLLLEFPFADTLSDILFDYVDFVFDCGLVPIIAHPERFSYLQENYGLINELSDRGCLFQVNTTSLTGLFGRKSRALGAEMIKHGFVDILATDAHSPDSRRCSDVLNHVAQFPENLISAEDFDRMARKTPALIVMDKDYKPQRGEYLKRHRGIF